MSKELSRTMTTTFETPAQPDRRPGPEPRKPLLRGLAVVLAVAAAILVPAWQFTSGFGLSAAQFSAEGDQTLKAAPWAFAIWGLIYAWLAVYALAQLWPGRETPRQHVLVWASVVPILGCAAWIIASALDARWPSVCIILVSAAFLTGELLRAAQSPGSRSEALLVVWPLGLLAGWLSVAAALNLLTVMTANGLIPAAQAELYALGGIAAVTVWSLAMQRHITAPTFGLAVAWGLIGVAAASIDADSIKGGAAGIAALACALSALFFRCRPALRPEPAPV